MIKKKYMPEIKIPISIGIANTKYLFKTNN